MNAQELTAQIEKLLVDVNVARIAAIEAKACTIVTLRQSGAESTANLTLALRHIEDAQSRIERALAELPHMPSQPHSRE